MKFTRIAPILFIVILASCQETTIKQPIDPFKVGKIKRVVILGNSIVRHSPKPEIGWNGDWGMAASCQDSDFVHMLIKDIHSRDESVNVSFKNIADYELAFPSYPLRYLDSFTNADMIILRISENIDDKKAKDSGLIEYYSDLIRFLDEDNKAVKVLVGGFWQKRYVNKMIRQYAASNNYTYIDNGQFEKDSTNTAKGLFANGGIEAHPSNKGMKAIEKSIWDYIQSYF